MFTEKGGSMFSFNWLSNSETVRCFFLPNTGMTLSVLASALPYFCLIFLVNQNQLPPLPSRPLPASILILMALIFIPYLLHVLLSSESLSINLFGTRRIAIQLLTVFTYCSGVSIFYFEQANIGWVTSSFAKNHLTFIWVLYTIYTIQCI